MTTLLYLRSNVIVCHPQCALRRWGPPLRGARPSVLNEPKAGDPADQSKLFSLCHVGHEIQERDLPRALIEDTGVPPPPFTPAPSECQERHPLRGEGYVRSVASQCKAVAPPPPRFPQENDPSATKRAARGGPSTRGSRPQEGCRARPRQKSVCPSALRRERTSARRRPCVPFAPTFF